MTMGKKLKMKTYKIQKKGIKPMEEQGSPPFWKKSRGLALSKAEENPATITVAGFSMAAKERVKVIRGTA